MISTWLLLTLVAVTTIDGRPIHPSFREMVILNSSNPYHKEDSPFDDYRIPVDINIGIVYVTLVDVDDARGIITFAIEISKRWTDPRLQYNEDVLGTAEVVVPVNLIWEPSVYCFNCIMVENIMDKDKNDALIYPDGTVTMYWNARLQTTCKSDTSSYPFDFKSCEIVFVEPQISSGRSTLTAEPSVDPKYVYGSEEWAMVPETPQIHNDTAIFKFSLSREPSFYMYFEISPVLLTTTICTLGMFIPKRIELFGKFTLGVTGLLALYSILSIILSKMPKRRMFLFIQTTTLLSGILLHYPLIRLKRWVRGGRRNNNRERNDALKILDWVICSCVLTICYVSCYFLFLGKRS